jgi:hypothetical protein
MRTLNFRDPRTVIIIAVVVVLLVWLVLILPVQHRFRSQLMDLNPADVDRITLQTEYRVDTTIPKARVVLTEDERREFLKLLAESHSTALNHPRGLWVCTATISTQSRVFELSIHHTSNNGTYLPLFSNGATGRNIGDFRNDGLAPFILRVLSRADPATQDAAAAPKQ